MTTIALAKWEEAKERVKAIAEQYGRYQQKKEEKKGKVVHHEVFKTKSLKKDIFERFEGTKPYELDLSYAEIAAAEDAYYDSLFEVHKSGKDSFMCLLDTNIEEALHHSFR